MRGPDQLQYDFLCGKDTKVTYTSASERVAVYEHELPMTVATLANGKFHHGHSLWRRLQLILPGVIDIWKGLGVEVLSVSCETLTYLHFLASKAVLRLFGRFRDDRYSL